MALEIGLDCGDAVVERTEDWVLEPIPGELGEVTFFGVGTRGRSLGAMEVPTGKRCCFYHSLTSVVVWEEVVEDDLHIGFRIDDLGHLFEEDRKLQRAVLAKQMDPLRLYSNVLD